ncbi:MAG: class I tRNA ligase family protein, partial [Trichodesmium sp. St17_bin3_1_1]|nr:class I tRNA ligase family protein [Trichodesmium sp. St17_bin3_1_1]
TKEGRVNFHPTRWAKVYNSWLENVRDWCISRQISWGHRIPAWHCADCGEITYCAGSTMGYELSGFTIISYCG